MNQTQWSEVKKVRFHHKVKRFYHKNLFRKIYTIAIIGLIGANIFSIVKYASFADEMLGLEQVSLEEETIDIDEGISDEIPQPSLVEPVSTASFENEAQEDEHNVGDEIELDLDIPSEDNNAIRTADVEQNTAELTTTASGDYKLTYNGNIYIIASGDLVGTYRRGNNTGGDSTVYNQTENNNRWGGSGDIASNGYDSGNPRSERQGPCPDDWHVPSRGEWQQIATAWCHLNSNDCKESDLTANVDEYGNLRYINNFGLRENFKSNFGMSENDYWTSSPSTSSDYRAWDLLVDSSYICPSADRSRENYYSIRCFYDYYNEYVAPTTYTLTFDSQGGTEVSSQPVEEGQTRSRPDDPTRTDYTFVDWYTSTEYDTLFDFTAPATADATAYAKWRYKDCAADQEYDSVNNLCYKLDTTYTVPVYYGVDVNSTHKYNNNPIGTITVKIDNGVYSGQRLTMMNINLGATEIYNQDIYDPNTASYGDHFQWGNNYGFSQDLYKSSTSPYFSSTPVAYENDGPGRRYNNSVFRWGGSLKDYWENDMHYNNLRGGYGDDVSNNRGGIANGSERQGPCPAGYHVPSQGERNAIVTYWYNKKYPSNPKNYANLNTIDNDANFKFAFLLPRAGSRGYQAADVRNREYDGKYWSSSPSSTSNGADAYDLHLYEGDSYGLHRIYASSYDNRTWGYSMRCFKDSSNAPEIRTITFNANGGSLRGTTNGILNQLVASGHLISQPVDPTKDGLVFDKWTTDQVGESEFDFSTPMSASTPTILYAQYGCDDGYEMVGDNCEPQQFTVTFDANRGTIIAPQTVYYGGKATQPITTFPGYTLDGWYQDSGFTIPWNFNTNIVTGDVTLYAKWTYNQTFDDLELYFVKSDGSTGHYTIMDRNLGATAVYNGNASNVESYGYYYQWGNNYGFPTTGNITTTSTKVPYSVWSNYVPSKYASGIFVVGSLSSWMENYTNATNLWGGTSDKISDRQGPCPVGYHVPTIGERNSLHGTWNSTTSSNIGSIFAYDLLLPPAGFRNYSNGVIDKINDYMDYWSSSIYQSDKTYSSILDMRVSNSRIDSARSHLYGLPVRCFKNSENSDTITLHMNGGKKTIIAFTGSVGNGNFTSLGTPQRDISHSFGGWYADALFEIPVTKGSTVTENLYAKWDCTPNYHDENGECIYNITTDNCTPGTMDNGHYIVEPVEITWNEENEEWNTVACINFVCDTHYHTGANNDTCEIDTFTITWKDGDEVLKSEILPYGANPSYTTSKDYYTFLRWDPSIVPVAGDMTYTAVWQANTDANGDNIADEEQPHHDLIIHYVNSKGKTLYPDYTDNIVEGASYSIPSQGKTYYIADKPIVSGIMGTEDIIVTVTYRTETDDTNDNGVADEDETPHTLTINYEYSRGGKAADSAQGVYLEGILYSIASPLITNYEADQLVVEGKMPQDDKTITVKYSPKNDENENEIADEEEERYSVIVHYEYSRGGAVTGDQSVVNLLPNQRYSIVSPGVQYYAPDQSVVSGSIDGENLSGNIIEITVKYTPNNDTNRNGIADEEERSSASNYSGNGRKASPVTDMYNSPDSQGTGDVAQGEIKGNEENNHFSAETQEKHSNGGYDSRYTSEQNTAYQFAYQNKITTVSTIREAKMNTSLTRIEMAKMLSYYAMNILGMVPDASKGMINFRDVPNKLNAQYDNGVILAYQLGIMGINMPNNEFRPFDKVTRAEFATALSRMIYGMEDGKGMTKYYEPHIARLYNEGIINNTNPKMQELRGNVMIMLMRSIKQL